MAATRERRTRPLVLGYLERIASSAFSEFPRQITDLVNIQIYTSPSLAGAAAVQRKTCNGWTFWEYEDSPGSPWGRSVGSTKYSKRAVCSIHDQKALVRYANFAKEGVMELDRAREIIQALAEGVDPYTGERFAPPRQCQRADAIHSLFSNRQIAESGAIWQR